MELSTSDIVKIHDHENCKEILSIRKEMFLDYLQDGFHIGDEITLNEEYFKDLSDTIIGTLVDEKVETVTKGNPFNKFSIHTVHHIYMNINE